MATTQFQPGARINVTQPLLVPWNHVRHPDLVRAYRWLLQGVIARAVNASFGPDALSINPKGGELKDRLAMLQRGNRTTANNIETCYFYGDRRRPTHVVVYWCIPEPLGVGTFAAGLNVYGSMVEAPRGLPHALEG